MHGKMHAMKIPRPWLRSSNQIWYVQIKGKQINLGRNKTAAMQKYSQLLAGNLSGDPITLAELITLYGRWLDANRKPSTVARRKSLLASLVQSLDPRTTPEQIRPKHLDAWIAAHDACSPTTVHTMITAVNAMLNWGVRFGHTEKNGIAGMPKPKPKIRQDYIPPERFAELLAHAKQHPDLYDLVYVALESGARAQEMFSARAEHFDKAGRRLVWEIENSKGQRTNRVVFLPSASLEIVCRRVGQYPTGPIFRNGLGRPWNRNQVSQRLNRIRKRMKLPSLCLTMLRHSFAHHRLTLGQDPVIVAKLLGHSSTAMIFARYGHLDGSQFLQDKADEFGLGGENVLR